MAKKKNIILSGLQAQEAVLKGADIATKVIISTMGPFGNCVAYDDYGTLKITKDGVTVSNNLNNISTGDGYEFGIKLAKQASAKMGENVGDGTTTVVAFLYGLMEKSFELLRKGYAAYKIVNVLHDIIKHSQPIIDGLKMKANSDDIKTIATIASNGDEQIATMLAELLKKEYSNVVIQGGDTYEDLVEEQEGICIKHTDRRFFYPRLHGLDSKVDSKKQITESDCFVLLSGEVNNIKDYAELLNKVAKDKKPLVWLGNFSEAVRQIIFANVVHGVGKFYLIDGYADGFYGEKKDLLLEDIQVLTGALLIPDDRIPTTSDLGKVGMAVFTETNTTLTKTNPDKEKLQELIKKREHAIESGKNSYDINNHKDSLGRLGKGVAIIKIGYGSSQEGKSEKTDRADDALKACQSAVKVGILPGGGFDFLLAAYELEKRHLSNYSKDNDSEAIFSSLIDAFKTPFVTIIRNSEKHVSKLSTDLIVHNAKEYFDKGLYNISFNVMIEKMCGVSGDKNPILNPAGILIHAIEIGCRTAAVFTKIKTLIITKEEGKEEELNPYDGM